MAINTSKKRMSARAFRIILCTALYTVLALFIGGLFAFSSGYPKIYDSPYAEKGKADFSNTDIPPRDVACNLTGEWEFFYNRWIITDGFDGEADGIIKLPGLWTGRDFGNGRLPKSGFASYRLTAENVQPDINIIVYRHYANFAFRVFLNGQLNYRSGTLSKNADETVVSGKTAEQHPYYTDGSPVEIVIEISAMNSGGFNTAPWLASTVTGNSYGTELRSFNYIALGITTAAVAISILTFAFFRYKRDITIPAFMIALYAHFLSSKDMLYVLGLRITTAMILQLFSAITAFILLAVNLWKNGASVNKIQVTATSASAAVLTGLLLIFYGTYAAPVFAFLLFFVGCSYLIPIVFNSKFASIQQYVYGTLFIMLMSVFCFELCDGLGLLVFGTEFIFTFVLMLMLACFTALWLWKMAKSARTAMRVSELECELASAKNQALKAQIKPHFIYNSLTAIQAQYRGSLADGDKAIEQFARHLRLITDSDGEEIIPFEDEVRNVLNYFELENLRADGKLNLLLDLDFTDFSVPVLSLQPLVENAVKHGGLRQKPDGYIQLTSRKTDSAVIITVTDNGKGFDSNSSREGVGIANTRKRFALVGAEMNIYAEPDRGTRAEIIIPLE